MDRLTALILFSIVFAGCAAGPYGPAPPMQTVVYYDNPMLLTAQSPEQLWEHVVDVVDDYFEIAEEIPVSQVDPVGRLNTVPLVGATLLEPWRHDSANFDEKLESTLQTIRRQAVVHVSRVQQGYTVEVIVYKQLEAVKRPMLATGDSSLLRNDDSLTRVVDPATDEPIDDCWIPLGRDTALEQRILGQLMACRPQYPL
ncbi:MAG TPA: hypothetical protein VJL29_11280 [Thermoguttaceae bacterium]|nr:hypothetical protein [Thermoguttaceae bacterium]